MAFIGPAPPPLPPERKVSFDLSYQPPEHSVAFKSALLASMSAWSVVSEVPAETAAHADSAAGQSLHHFATDFHGALKPCMPRLDGVGGSAIIVAEGTISVLLTQQGCRTPSHLGIVHNVLHAPTVTSTTLFSVSQMQSCPGNSCRLDSNDHPHVITGGGHVRPTSFVRSLHASAHSSCRSGCSTS